MLMPKKKILVYGAGSIGSYLAAKLCAAGHDVDVIGREKAKSVGKYIYINDEKLVYPSVFDEIDSSKHYDYLFLTSKYYDLKRNLEIIANSGTKIDLIVLIQNTYIDNSWYINLIRNTPFVVVSVVEGFNLEGNKLYHSKATGWFLDEEDMLSKDVYNLFKNSDISAQLTEDIDIKRAEKTVYNCALNAICALEGKPFTELFKDKEILKTMQGLFDESYEIISEIIPLHSKRSLWNSFLALKNMDHYSSTYQDVKKNKRTEVYFLNGFIIELGRKFGIPTPKNLEIVRKFRETYPELY